MNLINQVEAVKSLNEALVPGSLLIDGRTERDRLSFLSNFASLINFYNKDNTLNGNWAPFLLKDPVFLLASISNTNFSDFHTLYLNTCIKLQQLLIDLTDNIITSEFAVTMNDLFDQLTDVFMQIERWTYYMQGSDEEYDLKSYVIYQVKLNFSVYFWAMIGLRQNLFVAYGMLGVEPVKYYLFDSFNEITWKQNKDKSPYWEILGLNYPIKDNTAKSFYDALTKIGNELFNFFQAIIVHSTVEFEKVKISRSKYPDTTLLRTFINLLNVHQDQLNEISKKHLQFYYGEILKQSELPATPDNAIICAELAKLDATFILPAGTLFNAGSDAQKNPILFTVDQDVNLNPGSITGAYTINKFKGVEPGSFSSLYLNNIPDPGVLNRDKDGNIKYWEAFGSSTAPTETPVKQGIAFASPMLLLREGKRTIKFHLKYTGSINLQMLQDASYYLSTQNSWLYIKNGLVKIYPDDITDIDPLKDKSVIIEITLEPTDPPIESFIINPDGLDSKWPMVKIQFISFADLAAPPVLSSLKIEVTVSDVKTFQLYNDNGALSTKTPYQIFGPIPLVNSSFIIGNNEIFSKPLDSLYIELDWDKLPDDFLDYYQLYNSYLNGGLNIPNPIPPPEPTPPAEKKSIWTRIICWFKRKKNKTDASVPPKYQTPFNNCCFTVGFNLLQDATWKYFDLSKRESINVSDNNQISAAAYNDVCCSTTNNLLFSTDNCNLTGESFFAYPPLIIGKPSVSSVPVASPRNADPGIQNGPFNFTDTSTSGFMKMVLTGPSYGFGSEIYSKVVSQIALYNSWFIFKEEDPALFSQQANLPFAPKAINFVASYTASQTYDLTSVTGTYPVQCYLYAPFSNYKVYDNSSVATGYSNTINKSDTTTCSVPLFPSFNYSSCLFLQMENLLPTSAINLYFELTRKFVAGSSGKPAINYLSSTGWKELSVLSDGTNNFNCSGIIKISVPYDIANESLLMPDKKYWFYIGVKDDFAAPAQIVFLKTNGFSVQRSGTSFLTDMQAPKLASNAITGPQTAIPQIAAIVQPFSSYGGKAAESQLIMNRRVSNRLKTKDRAVTADDYFRLISQQYNDIYYSKTVFDKGTKNTDVYVVKTYESYTEPNAFAPQVSACTIDEIQSFLQNKASGFASIAVSNFDLFPINITTTVLIKPEFISNLVQIKDNMAQALNIFLSPWISSSSRQIVIDQEITDALLAKFIHGMEGVLEVQNISFSPVYDGKEITGATLFVSGMNHDINLKCNT